MGAALACFEVSTGPTTGLPHADHHKHNESRGHEEATIYHQAPLDLQKKDAPKKEHHHHHEEEKKSEGFFDSVHSAIGKKVADSIRNEDNQAKMGKHIGDAAKNKETQQRVAVIVAEKSDNDVVKLVASNQQVQGYVGDSVASMAGNKDVQRAVANTLAAAAEDRETQKKVASAVWSGTKTSSSFLADVGVAAAKAYMSQGEKDHHHD